MATDIRVSELDLIQNNKNFNQIIVNDLEELGDAGTTKRIEISNLLTEDIVKERNIVNGAITADKINSECNFTFNNTTITSSIFLSGNINMNPGFKVDGVDVSELGDKLDDLEGGFIGCTGTVTSVEVSAGTGISITGAPTTNIGTICITDSGIISITNASPNATHTGDVTGSAALTIANNCVSNAKLAVMSLDTIKGRITLSGDPQDLTAAQVRTLINVAPISFFNLQAVTDTGNTTTNSLSVAALSVFGKIIGGSATNTAAGAGAAVLGGSNNKVNGDCSTVLGGRINQALSAFSNVAGGCNNKACGVASNVAGGRSNTANGDCSGVGAGAFNTACDDCSTVTGGVGHVAKGRGSTILGGSFNCTNDQWNAIAGGAFNHTDRQSSTVTGGICNCACGSRSHIAGGLCNLVKGTCSIINGGGCNIVYSSNSSVGGLRNTVHIISNYSSIIGGTSNTICSTRCNSFIVGSNITSAAACYTFVNNLSSQGAVRAQSISLNGRHIFNDPGGEVTFDGNCSNIWSTTRKNTEEVSGTLHIEKPINIRTGTYILTLHTGGSEAQRAVCFASSNFCFPNNVPPTLSNGSNCLDIIHLLVLEDTDILYAVDIQGYSATTEQVS